MSKRSTAAIALPPFQADRVCEDEILDQAAAADGAGSLSDMVRINRLFGGFRVLRGELRVLARGQKSLRVLDVAAGATGTGRWLEEALPGASVTSVDIRADLLALGQGRRVAADALSLPFANSSFDVVVNTLFLHHLSESALGQALSEMLRVSRLGVAAVDLVRHPLSYRFLSATRFLFGWNWITMVDGARSVQAAFTVPEMREALGRFGFEESKVRSHHPWFRLSVRIPKLPSGNAAGGVETPDSVLSSGL